MSEQWRAEARYILTNPDEHTEAVEAFDPEIDQRWHTNPFDITRRVRSEGGAVIGSTSCNMQDLLSVCKWNDWQMTFEAGGVYKVVANE